MRSNILRLSTIAISLVILWLFTQNDLRLYIHPRYELFTVVLVGFGALVLVVSLWKNTKIQVSWTVWLVATVALLALFIPPTTLSDTLAGSRLQRTSNAPTTAQSTFDTFSADLTRFDVRDWSAFLSSGPPANGVVGKKADVIGFIFNENDQRFIARYQLTCCAVDATPLAIPLADNDKLDTISDGEWLQLQGEMVSTDSQTYQYQLLPQSFTVIDEPEQAYVY